MANPPCLGGLIASLYIEIPLSQLESPLLKSGLQPLLLGNMNPMFRQ